MYLVTGRTIPISLYKMVIGARTLFWQELFELLHPANSAAGLAASFVLGTLLSFIPVPLLDSLMVGVVMSRIEKANRGSLFIARLIWSDLVIFSLYRPGYRLGSTLLTRYLVSQPDRTVAHSALAPILGFALGNLMIAFGTAAIGYLVFFVGIKLFRSAYGRRGKLLIKL